MEASAWLEQKCIAMPEHHFDNPFLFVRTGLIAKLFFMRDLYESILHTPGSIAEVGSWLGQTSIILENIRAISEPFNNTRKFISFDSFEGYCETGGLAIEEKEIDKYTQPAGWIGELNEFQQSHIDLNMGINKKENFVNVSGDCVETIPTYLEHTDELFALVYYDIATESTARAAFENFRSRISVGGCFVFDDIGSQYPGVAKVVRELVSIDERFDLQVPTIYPSKLICRRVA